MLFFGLHIVSRIQTTWFLKKCKIFKKKKQTFALICSLFKPMLFVEIQSLQIGFDQNRIVYDGHRS